MRREDLTAVRTIVTHDNCADGTASAILLHDALPDAEIVFTDYGSSLELEARPNMLFCDFSPPRARVAEFVRVDAIVLDHHRSAKAVVEQFGERGIYADEVARPGVSGAVLAFEQVWRVMRSDHAQFAETFATAAGVRDTWQTEHAAWRDSCVQHAVLHAFPQQFWLSLPFGELALEWRSRYEWIGEQLIVKAAERVDYSLENSHRFTSSTGLRVVVVSSHSVVSDLAERVGAESDVVIAFGFGNEHGKQVMRLSLRSGDNFDCAAFAQRFGGGGHTHAAGFAVPLGAADPNPFAMIERMLG